MLASIHVGEIGWTRRPDLEAQARDGSQFWQAPVKEGRAGTVRQFHPGRRPTVLAKVGEDELRVPSFSGW